MIAETKLGRADEAFVYYKKIARYREEISEIHRMNLGVMRNIAGKGQAWRSKELISWSRTLLELRILPQNIF